MEISATKSFFALITAAGSGRRLGGERPKQYMELAGKAIIRRTVETFLSCPGLQELRVIIDPAHEALYRDSMAGLDLPPPVHGGPERQASIRAGIESFSELDDDAVILLHDAVRPFIRRERIEQIVAAVHDGINAASLALPVADTLARAEDGSYVNRAGLMGLQTPQAFRYGLIRRAHKNAENNGNYTDDTSLVAALGEKVEFLDGDRENFKITTMDDLAMARRLTERPQTRTGTGFDVHAFCEGNKVRLCGIDIPFDRGLAGHSDADVGLHALTDALLGAIAAGDIGSHFPPSDPQWKGADSAVFLKHAVETVKERGGRIVNLDLTLICEAPKIGLHREAMQARVAEICGISPDRVGIKATTTEGLGFTGRREGIAAQAVATVEVP